MALPIVAGNRPLGVELKAGEEYYFCACGQSDSQPFCDGSHAGTEFTPVAFTAEKTGKAFLCTCKAAGGVPFCDGTHKKFGEDDIGKPAAE